MRFKDHPALLAWAVGDVERAALWKEMNQVARMIHQIDLDAVEGQPNDPAKVKSEDWHDRHSYEWLPELCRRYGCGLVDVRRPWLQYPTENHLRATDVLSDGTHLNAQGNWLLAELTKRCLRSNAALPQVTRAGLVRDYSAGSDFSWKDGRR